MENAQTENSTAPLAQPAEGGEVVAWTPALTYPDYEMQRVWANGKPRPEDVDYWTRQGIGITYAYGSPPPAYHGITSDKWAT